MPQKNPAIDAYIAAAPNFARPILKHLRRVVHAGCPAVEETIKWQFPFFVHKGNLAHMAAFKAHCAFGFWKRALLFGPDEPVAEDGMGQFGRIRKMEDLPDEQALIGLVRRAAELNEAGVQRARPARTARPRLTTPNDFAAALRKNAKAAKTWQNFTPGKRRDYLQWITDARREETRRRRISTAVEWLAQGKTQNWKYER